MRRLIGVTSQEFINKLSPKTKKIISGYELKNSNKRNIIIYLNYAHTRVDMSDPNKYIFEIKIQDSPYDMEYALLHEFYHCIQRDNGFPYTIYKNSEYQKISSYISSIILDCDVYDRLLNDGYKESPDILHRNFVEIQKLLMFFLEEKEKEYKYFLDSLDNQIFYSGKLLLLSKYYDEKDAVIKLIDLSKRFYPLIYNCYCIFSNAIQKFGFSSPETTRKIFENVIENLNLTKFIEII